MDLTELSTDDVIMCALAAMLRSMQQLMSQHTHTLMCREIAAELERRVMWREKPDPIRKEGDEQ